MPATPPIRSSRPAMTSLTSITLLGLGLAVAGPAASQQVLIETFEDGLNSYHLDLGSPGGDPVVATGGNPGAWLRSHESLATFMPMLMFDAKSGTPEPFVGDYVEQGVHRIALDAISVWSEYNFRGREFSIRLINFGGNPYDPKTHTHLRFIAGQMPEIGEGWKHFSIDIPSDWQGDGVPPGWTGGSWEDWNELPVGTTVQDVLRNVDQVQIGWGNPSFFYPLMGVTVGVDNVAIHYGRQATGETAAWLPVDADIRGDLNAVHFADALNGLAVGSAGAARLSDDGGLTWTIADTGASDDLTGAATTAAGHYYTSAQPLYRSSDFGASWELVPGSGMGPMTALIAVDDEHVVAIENNRIMYSHFSGKFWSQASPVTMAPGLHTLSFPTAQTGFAFGGEYISPMLTLASLMRSTDGGLEWHEVATPLNRILAGDFTSADHGLVATDDGGLWRTLDGGDNWTAVDVTWPWDWDEVTVLRSRGAGHWYLGTYGGRLLESRDNGETWALVHEDADERRISGISPGPGAARAVGSDGLALYQDRILRDGFGVAMD